MKKAYIARTFDLGDEHIDLIKKESTKEEISQSEVVRRQVKKLAVKHKINVKHL